MKIRAQLCCVSATGADSCPETLAIERTDLAMETSGLMLVEGMALLHGVQERIVAAQVAKDPERPHRCPDCGTRYPSKGQGRLWVRPDRPHGLSRDNTRYSEWSRCARARIAMSARSRMPSGSICRATRTRNPVRSAWRIPAGRIAASRGGRRLR